MKSFFCFIFAIFYFVGVPVFAETDTQTLNQGTDQEQEKITKHKKTDYEEKSEVLKYGLSSEVIELILQLQNEKDTRFIPDLITLFTNEKNIKLKTAILSFFTELNDASIENEVATILADFEKYNTDFLRACIQYCAKCKLKDEAVTLGLKTIIDENKTEIKESAIIALGSIGNSDDALYLISVFESEDENGNDSKLSLIFRQAVMQALIELKEKQTVDFLKECVLDTFENTIIRARAITALGKLGPTVDSEIIDILVRAYEETDPIIREAVIAGLTGFSGNETASRLLLLAFKDEYYKVRLKAIETSYEMKSSETIPLLFYRAKNDPEMSVKNAAIEALGVLGNAETDEWLREIFNDSKTHADTRIKVAVSLLKNKPDFIVLDIEHEIVSAINDRQKKQFVYNLGKNISPYKHAGLVRVAELFLKHTDASFKSIGLDMFKANHFQDLVPIIQEIADDKKSGALQNRALSLLSQVNSDTAQGNVDTVENADSFEDTSVIQN